MRRYTLAVLCLTVLLAAGPALAATTAAQRAAFIAPFVDDQTVAVVYLDLSAVDPDAVAAEMERPHMVGALKTDLGHLTDAGAHEVYVVVSTAYLLYPPYLVVIPLGQNVDADAIATVLRDLKPETAVINGALCVAPPGVMARFRSVAPAARPELTAALAAAGDAPLVVALIPTADNRRVIEETLPVLPKRFGGGPSAVLTRGVTWATASLHLPPKMSAFFVVRSADPQAAQALAGWVNEFRASVPPLAPFRPEVGPAGVTFHVSTDELRTLIDKTVVPVLGQARAEAASAASQSNLHQILLAAMMYRQDHQKEWPDNLQQLTKYLGDPSVLRNPLRPDLEVGYDYRKPAEKAPANTAVVWEKFDQWPAAGVNVGYVDAAVGRMRDKERFDHVLEKGR